MPRCDYCGYEMIYQGVENEYEIFECPECGNVMLGEGEMEGNTDTWDGCEDDDDEYGS